MQEQHLVAQAPRLAEVVRRHDDLGAGGVEGADQRLDLARRARDRGSPWARRETAPRAAAPRRARARGAAARRRRARAPAGARDGARPTSPALRMATRVGIGDAGDLQRVAHVGERRAAQHHRPLEHHRLPASRHSSPLQTIVSRGGREQAVHRRISTLLPGAVGAEDDGARPGLESRAMSGSMIAAGRRTSAPACRGRIIRSGAAPPPSPDRPPALSASTMAISTMPSAERERQVALGGLERDRRGHHARHAVDVAADDHHRADLGRRAAEAGEHRRDEREADVPEQRQRSAARRARRASAAARRTRATRPRPPGGRARR